MAAGCDAPIPPSVPKECDVFISYNDGPAEINRVRAGAAKCFLENVGGLHVFHHPGELPTDPDEGLDLLRSCKCVVIFLTSVYMARVANTASIRDNISEECRLAVQEKKNSIVFAALEPEALIASEWPPRFREWMAGHFKDALPPILDLSSFFPPSAQLPFKGAVAPKAQHLKDQRALALSIALAAATFIGGTASGVGLIPTLGMGLAALLGTSYVINDDGSSALKYIEGSGLLERVKAHCN